MGINVIVVGGGPAGVVTALTAKSVYPEKSVCVIKEIGDGVIPCAIPYMMHTLADTKQNAMGNTPLQKAGIEIKVGKVVSLDAKAHTATLRAGEVLSYEKLVLATGTEVCMPPIPGVDKQGVFSIKKSMSAMNALREKVHQAKKIVIIGGGFIGAEFADELSKDPDAEIYLIEIMPKLLLTAFDDEFCDEITLLLEKQRINIRTAVRVVSIDGKEGVESVSLESGEKVPADLVLVSIGAKPSSKLAEKAGLRIIDNGSIWVDDYMRTDAEDVFAVGDCALKRDFF
ncbi:MAG: FAD-dependent oxidoreductase, partial [Deltaproteobacteria bacterium]|nr:FAD-dependent oxidoreductase [Deltaproteobacteria bacterium]